ncbi:MAG TPA: GGDEF domain-containing protein [Lachnospiraceae bacterium]|nr:GGDEF domain-containing protein [Lachnospiraceae bacterium]
MFSLDRKSRPFFYSVVTGVVLLIGGIIFFVYGMTIHVQDMSFNNDQVHEWSRESTVSYGDMQQKIASLPFFTEGREGEILTYTTILKKQDDIVNTIMFREVHQKVRVYLDGERVYSFGYEDSSLVGKTPGNVWVIVRLPEQYDGVELKIELETIYSRYGRSIGKLYLGTKSSLLYMVLLQGVFGLILELPVFLIGIGLFVIGFLFRNNRLASRRIIYLGIFALLASSWMILEESIGQLYFRRPLINFALVYIIYGILPIVLLRFLMTYRSFAMSKYIKGIFWLSILNFITVHILQFTNIRDYMETNIGIHLIWILTIAGCLGIYIKERIIDKDPRKDIFTAAFVFSVFGIIDILRYYCSDYKSSVLFYTRIGLAFFILILGYSAVKQISGEHAGAIEETTYKKLAYTDLMTELPNRTAFEKQMEAYKVSGKSPIIAIVDINDLKSINDTYGHKAGDDAIRMVGKNLVDTLGSQVSVYRIGGDEFCALSDSVTEDEFNEYFQKIQVNLEKLTVSIPYSLTAACGYIKTGEEGIDKAFIEADHRMYQVKVRLKGIMDEETS